MISSGGETPFDELVKEEFDFFFYGLGFETRSTKIVSCVKVLEKIFALKMPEIRVHSYDRNQKYAQERGHRIIANFDLFFEREFKKVFEKKRTGLRIGFDVSSVNRIMLIELLAKLSESMGEEDQLELFYCPAAYAEPNWLFPQIQRLGPVNGPLSGFNADPSKPLCLMLGMGFEAGVSMGIISQLEPSISYCFWGKGVDPRFDEAVCRANFDFDFPSFNTKVFSYNVRDPKGVFELLENVVYSLVRTHRIVIVPMGPKLFTALVALVGITYAGDVAVWRVQHSQTHPADSIPGNYCVHASLDVELLRSNSARAASALLISN